MRMSPIAAASQKQIEEALLALLSEKPYGQITVSELAHRASLSRQTFYMHFASKEAVLARHLHRLFDDIMAEVRRQRARTVSELVAAYTGIVEKHAPFFLLLAQNDLTGTVCSLFAARLAALPPVLPTQRDAVSEAERRYCNTFWVAAFTEVYALWLTDGRKTPRPQIERILTDIMRGSYFSS